jgi:hypothetical protein
MSWTESKFKDIIYVLLLTILLIFTIEVLMLGVFSLTKSKYFTSLDEYRFGTNSCYNNSRLDSGKVTKIAIFGGSSAAGYGSPISFTKLMCDSNFTNKRLFIRNYSENGAKFSDFQADIAKKVLDQYDVIVIYSGHNEYLVQFDKRESYTILPNGIKTNNPKLRRLIIERRIKEAHNPSVLKSIINNSRIYYFLLRLINRYTAQTEEISKHDNIVFPKMFYYNNEFMSDIEIKDMTDSYKKNIVEISAMLRDDQKLIISTVLSNDLFPPVADVYLDNKINDYNEIARLSYSMLANGEYGGLEKMVEKLPISAHRYYIDGVLCLSKTVKYEGYFSQKCLSKLKMARESDALKVRIIPEINKFIRQFKHKNVIVIDPVKDFLSKIVDLNEYRSNFIDFQHPSQLGHALIAENILNEVLLFDQNSRHYSKEFCGISWHENGKLQYSELQYNECVNNYENNINWLNNIVKYQPTTYQYNYYKTKAEEELKKLKFLYNSTNRVH